MNDRILPLLALILAVAIFFGYINRTWNGDIANAKARIITDDTALAAANEYAAKETSLAASRDTINADSLARLKELLPDSVDNVALILDLNALAARSGLALSSIDVAQQSSSGGTTALPTDNGSPVGSVDLSLAASGSYPALRQFLDGIEKSLRLLDVENLSITGTDTGVYNYTMRIRLYWLR